MADKTYISGPMTGWQNSRGARLEMHIARELGLRIYALTGEDAVVLQSAGSKGRAAGGVAPGGVIHPAGMKATRVG